MANKAGGMSKPLILFFPFPLLSHYTRCLMLAHELRHHFECRFAADAKYDSLIAEKGFGTFSCENFDADTVMEHSRRFSFDWMKRNELERVFLSQVSAIAEMRPQLIAGDAAFTLRMAGEQCGVKMIALLNGYMTRFYAGTRKISRTHPAYKYSQSLPPNFFDRLTRFMEGFAFRKVHQPFLQIRRQYGLSRPGGYLQELEGDVTLVCDIPDLFPQKQLPANFHFIGPLFYKAEHNEDEILSRLENGKPTVLVSMGSSGDWNKLTPLCSDAFSSFNIITAGDERQVLRAPHITSRRFLNNDAVLPFCDVMICHGGNGTIYQALSHHVPVLCVTSIFEQEWNVNRLEELGLGQALPDRFSDEELKRLLERWMAKEIPSVVEQIGRYDAAYRRHTILPIAHKLMAG
jgi:UDP:flavonoid glycosyltransferase YjiC (YdhE family)